MAYRGKRNEDSDGYKRDSKGNLKLTKEEAFVIRDDFARTKDFWIYDMESNKELLQAALGVLHNTMEGNNYSVDYHDSQNSSRLIIYCGVCFKTLSSYDPFMTHDAGKAHKKAVQTQIKKKEVERECKDLLTFKPLNSVKNEFESGTLEDELNHAKEPVLGMQFVYKERIQGPDSDPSYTCQLCDLHRVDKTTLCNHILEDTAHNRKYLMVKFNYRGSNSDAYMKKCMEIELLEGKVTHTIVDFTGQFLMASELDKSEAARCSSPPCREDAADNAGRSSSPTRPLSSEAGCQVDTDELDMSLDLTKEIAMLNLNGCTEAIGDDREIIEVMLQTLQTLNMKMNNYYTLTGKQMDTSKYQGYISELNGLLKETIWEE